MWKVLALVSTLALHASAAQYAAYADTYQDGNQPSLAVDGDESTFWHSEYDPTLVSLPHYIVLDLGASEYINGFTYLPRQDGNSNGNIGKYSIQVSSDKKTWTQVTSGTFVDDESLKETGFPNVQARYVRLKASTEAGNRGPWSSAAEINVNLAPTSAVMGEWGPMIAFPLVPAAAFVLHDTGKILTFASSKINDYLGTGQTYTATYDPVSGNVSEMDVTNTQHDMFCPGLSMDTTGRAIVTGGDDASKTSIYDPVQNMWIAGPEMQIARGYQASATLSDGRTFVIGGSWSGGFGGKNGEIYDPASNTWSLLPGCPVAPMLTNDAQGIFRQDNHGWLFAWKNESIFQAGPSHKMNWYSAIGSGSTTPAGNRASDSDSMDGNAIMFDAVKGKILTVGGSTDYQYSYATSNAHIITLGAPNTKPSVQTIGNMNYQRAFANGVILPDGTVFITGGQSYAIPFSDGNSTLTPELFNPSTNKFTVLPPHNVPRNYHSVALLMPDGRVFTAGGGLCGDCETNHEDAQIYSPAYLFSSSGALATRPQITSISTTSFKPGATITVTSDTALTSFSLIRSGSATHTVDTDQRRVTLTLTKTAGSTYTLKVPSDAGVVVPGYWMLFGLNSAGVPTVAKSVVVRLS